MADPRNVEYEEFDGASPAEQLVHAARSNNIDLMKSILENCKNEEEAADLLNNAKDGSGRYVYHIAASQGLYEIIDWLTTQEGFECDPISQASGEQAGDTPLHSVVRFINNLPPTPTNLAAARRTSKNKQGHTPVTLVAAQNPELKKFIQNYTFDDEEEETYPAPEKQESNYLDYDEVAEEDDERSVYSGSDSEEEEEFNRRKAERAKKAGS
ncbi:ankyrin repeat protein [Botrytis cinerea]